MHSLDEWMNEWMNEWLTDWNLHPSNLCLSYHRPAGANHGVRPLGGPRLPALLSWQPPRAPRRRSGYRLVSEHVSPVGFRRWVPGRRPKGTFFFLFSLGCRCESALSHSGLVRVFTSHVFNLCYFESDSPLQWCQLTLNWATICVWPKMTQRWLSISHAYLSCVHFGLVLTRRVVVSHPCLILMTHICLTTRVAVAESY